VFGRHLLQQQVPARTGCFQPMTTGCPKLCACNELDL
jgi:hypothetical protein